MLYVYAFAERPATLPEVDGIGGSGLAVEPVGDIDAVVSDVDGESVGASEEAILAHARVVEALAERCDAVLPARFGRGYADAESLRRAAAPRVGDLREALELVRGSVELGIRVLAPARPQRRGATASGREYMVTRLEARRRAEQVAEQLDAPLGAIARAGTRSVSVTPQLLLTAAYLVDRADVDRFRATVERLQHEHPDLTIACTGPWPPYSFATVEGAEG